VNPQMAKAHREAFEAAMLERSDDPVAILGSGHERLRNGDVPYPFRPHSHFWYLTGFAEPDAYLVLRPASQTPLTFFVRPRDREMEIWNGRRAGVEGMIERFGADAAHPVEALFERLPDLLRGADTLYARTGEDHDFDARLLALANRLRDKTRDGTTGPPGVVDPGTLLNELRLFKSDDELAILRRAAAITEEAHRAAMAALEPGVHEYEIEAVVDGTFRRRGGWGPGYGTIAASGANACILHYRENDARVGEDDLMLLDAGCEVDGYTADVTRTFPAAGRYSPAQREMYEVVLAAQRAALDQVRPGHTFLSVHERALETLVRGLLDLELLAGTVEEHLEGGGYRKYFMHKTSHWLGLDVHDVGSYFTGTSSRPLEPGMVMTIEPGLYVPEDDEIAPERMRGVGIRIEDDVLVTADGHENLTAAVPKTVAEVEAAC